MGIQEAFLKLAKDKEINGYPRRILDYLFGKLGFENYICIQQKEIAEELGINKTHVSTGIKLLFAKRNNSTRTKTWKNYILPTKF